MNYLNRTEEKKKIELLSLNHEQRGVTKSHIFQSNYLIDRKLRAKENRICLFFFFLEIFEEIHYSTVNVMSFVKTTEEKEKKTHTKRELNLKL